MADNTTKPSLSRGEAAALVGEPPSGDRAGPRLCRSAQHAAPGGWRDQPGL
jgi:hypothetical protein